MFAFALPVAVDQTPIPLPAAVSVPAIVVTVAAPAPIPTRIVVPATGVAAPGHYACSGVSSVDPQCSPDPAEDVDAWNPTSDRPGTTLGSTDRSYSDSLASQLCEAKPVFCGL